MRKVIKISGKVLAWLLVAVLALPLAVALLLNVAAVQNFAVDKAAGILSARLGTTISIDRIRLSGFSRLEADGLYIEDLAGDTLLYAGRLGAAINKGAILRKCIIVEDISLDSAKIYLYTASDSVMNLTRLLDRLSQDTVEKESNMRLLLRDVVVRNSRFKMQTAGADTLAEGVNYSNLILDDLAIASRRIEIAGGDITMDIKEASFRDVSGFRVERLSAGSFRLVDGGILFDDAEIVTPDSDLRLDRMYMQGESWEETADFMNLMRFDVQVSNSRLAGRTLAYFVPSLAGPGDVVLEHLDATLQGPLNDFSAEIAFGAMQRTRFSTSVSLSGLFDLPHAVFSIPDLSLSTTGRELRSLAAGFLPAPLPPAFDMIARAGGISLTGKISGRTSDAKADLCLKTDAGNITVRGRGGMAANGNADFDAQVFLDGVQAGRLLASPSLGSISATLKAGGTLRGGVPDIHGNLFVPMAEFNGYTYNNLMADGSYVGDRAAVTLNSDDPKLSLAADASASFGEEPPVYDLDLLIRSADLHGLGFNKADSVSMLSGHLSARGSGTGLDDINADALLSDLRYVSSTDRVNVDSISLTGRNNDESKYLALNSSYLDIEFRSGIGYKEIFGYLGHVLYDYLPSLDASGSAAGSHRSRPHATVRRTAAPSGRINRAHAPQRKPGSLSELHVNIKGANNIAAIFLPGFSIAEGTRLDFVFDPASERFTLKANSDYIEYSSFFVTRLGLQADNTGNENTAAMRMTTEDLYLPQFVMPSNDITAIIGNDAIDVDARLSKGSADISARLDIHSVLSRNDGALTVALRFNPQSHVVTGNRRWDISSRDIHYSPSRILVDDFSIDGGGQGLMIDGVVSENRTDTLSLALDRIDVGMLGSLLSPDGSLSIGGRIDGTAKLISGLKAPVLFADIALDGISLNGYTAAPLSLRSAWDFAEERAGISLRNTANGKHLVRGFYRPSTGHYFATVDIDGVPLAAASAFLPEGTVRSLEGTAALYAEVNGSKGMPNIDGTLSIADLAATVGLTNVTYSTPQLDVEIDDNIATVPATPLTDNEGHKAILSAGADLRNAANVSYEVKLLPQNIMAINTSMKENPDFYGKVYVSGAINLRGSRNGIDIDVAATTQDNSTFYLPLSGKSNMAEADWIVFENSEKSVVPADIVEHKKQQYLESMRKIAERAEKTDMNLNVSLNITPGLLLSIIIDPVTNITLNARGTAALDVLLNPGTGELTTFGTYEISDGDFLFNLPPFISNKHFALQQGGTIQLSGDPMDALLNIEAVYRLRASLQPLASSFEGTGISTSTRIPVECIVRISESLRRPDISFDIRIPSADTDIQNVLNGVMASNEATAYNFLTLVGLGSFAPEGTDGMDTNAASTGTSIGIDFLTNQLTNMISNDQLSVMFNYRPQDETSSNELDFGFSYNVGGNDRLVLEVEGNYDMGDNPQSLNNYSGLSGDASITWALTPNGDLRLKGFTRTINRYDENQGLQENGIGIYYKEDFNVFGDIVRKAHMRKAARQKKREERRAARTTAETPAATDFPEDMGTRAGTSDPEEEAEIPIDNSRIERRREKSRQRREAYMEEMRRRAAEQQAAGQEDPGAPRQDAR